MAVTVTTTGSPESIAMNVLLLSQAAAAGSQADLCAAIMGMVNKVERIITTYTEENKSLKSQTVALEARLQQNQDAATAREEALRGEISALSLRQAGSETEIAALRQQISATNQTATAALARANNHAHYDGFAGSSHRTTGPI